MLEDFDPTGGLRSPQPGTLTGFQVRFHVDPAGDTCSRTWTQQESSGRGLRALKPRGHLPGSKLHSSSQEGKLRVGPRRAAATGTFTGNQVRFHVDTCSRTSTQQGSSGRGLRAPQPRGHLPGSEFHVHPAGDTCSRTSTQQGKLRAPPKLWGHLPGSKLGSTLTQREMQAPNRGSSGRNLGRQSHGDAYRAPSQLPR